MSKGLDFLLSVTEVIATAQRHIGSVSSPENRTLKLILTEIADTYEDMSEGDYERVMEKVDSITANIMV